MSTLQSDRHAAADPERPGHGVPGGRRAVLAAALGPLVAGYVGVAAVLALVTATVPGATLSTGGVLRAAGPGWLALYHVPITLGGHPLGMLPLLPTVLVLALVARTARNTARRLGCDTPRSAVRVIGPLAGAHAVFAVVITLLSRGTAAPVIALFTAGILAAVAATAGVAGPCGLLDAVTDRADDASLTGLRVGLLAVFGLIAVGALVFAAGLLLSWQATVHTFRTAAPGGGSGLGLFLLSVAYLPNVLIGTLSFAAGPGFTIGGLSAAPWHLHLAPVPAVPVLAPIPATQAHSWLGLMALPAAVGVLTGLRCRTGPAPLRSVGVAALVAAVTWLVLAALAGGALAGGPFSPVTVPAGLLAAAVFAFVALPGALALTGRARPAAAVEPEPAPEPEEEPQTEPEASAEE